MKTVKLGDIQDTGGVGGEVSEELPWVSSLKSFEGPAFHPFPNFDQFAQWTYRQVSLKG